MGNKKINIVCLGLMLTSLSSCVEPLIIGGGAVAAGMATREKRITTTISDTQISTEVKGKLYSADSDLFSQVNTNVCNGEVLLTGLVQSDEWKDKATQLSWQVNGVINVHNYIEVGKIEDFGNYTLDGIITTRAKSTLLMLSDVYSLNYSIKTVNKAIYLMGMAQKQEELDKVVRALSNLSGVSKVVSLVKVKPPITESTLTKSEDNLQQEVKPNSAEKITDNKQNFKKEEDRA